MPPERRPNRKEQKAKATRRNILVAASRLFARHGFHKTTVADIAAEIGMTSGAIFHHFPSKEAVLAAVVDRLGRGLEEYSRLMTAGAASSGTVRGVVDLMCQHFNQQPEATICLAALATEFAGTGHPIVGRLLTVYDTFVDTFSAVLAHHPRVTDPRAAAIAFMGSVQGIAIQGLLRREQFTIEDLAHGLLDMLGEW